MTQPFNPELDGLGVVKPLRQTQTKTPPAPPNPAFAEALQRALQRKQ